MKNNKRTAPYILLALSAIIVLFIYFAPRLIIQHQVDAKAYPDTGVFYCKELDAYLTFSEDGIILTTANGSQEDIHVHPAGRFCTEDSKINMWYKWNNQEKYIEVQVISFPGILEDEVFRFNQ